MREYDDDDDNIRLYAPVLQRVIILAAVIIAVPVMMWTITTFIRSYVARPKVPTFQHVAEPSPGPSPASPLAASLPPAPQPAQPAAPALADAGTTASDARAPLPDAVSGPPKVPMLAPPPGDAGPPAGPPPSVPAHSPPPVPPLAGPPPNAAPNTAPGPAPNTAASAAPNPAASAAPIAAPSPAPNPTPPSAAQNPPQGVPSSPANAAPAPSAPIPPSATPAQPAQNQPPPAAPRIAANASGSAPAAPGNRNYAWPNPNAESAPGFGDTPQSPATTQTASAEAAPGVAPIAGRIPLPRHRPDVVATAATGSIESVALTGHVPLPRARPASAPAEAAPVTNAPYGYEPGLESGR